MRLRVGEATVDLDRIEIERGGEVVAVQPQVFDVVAYLVERPDRLVTREELLDNIWGDRFVSLSALTSRIKSARRALGDDGDRQAVIKTVHGRGYRLVAEVEPADDSTASPSAAPSSTAPPMGEDGSARSGPPPVPSNGWPMVGRDEVLDQIACVFGTDTERGALVSGPDRIGTTTLLHHVVERARGLGRSAELVSGRSAARDVPLSAIAHLLPTDVYDAATSAATAEGARLELWHGAREALAGDPDDGPPIIAIDDPLHLDELSRSLLSNLSLAGAIVVVLAERLGTDTADATSAWGDLRPFDLAPLDEVDIDVALFRRLGGPISLDCLKAFSELSSGNPGRLVDLVDTTISSGGLVAEDGVWRLVGPIRSRRATTWAADDVEPAVRHGAELLSLLGGLPLDLAVQWLGSDVLDALDLARVIVLDERQTRGAWGAPSREPEVRIADPVLATAIADSIGSLRRHRLQAEILELSRTTAIPPATLAAIVRWPSGKRFDPVQIGDAAIVALVDGDHAAAEALVDELDAADPVAAVVRAEVAADRGQVELAERHLDQLDVDELDESLAGLAIRRRVELDFVHRGARDEVLERLEQARLHRSDTVAAELGARQLSLLASLHRYPQLMERHAQLAIEHPPHALAEAEIALSFALNGSGRFGDSLVVLDRAEAAMASAHAAWVREVQGTVLLLRASALQQLGRIGEAADVARRHLSTDRVHRLGFFPAVAADIELTAGRPRAAREIIRAGGAASARRVYPQFDAVIDAMAARCHVALGDVVRAGASIEAAETAFGRATGAPLARAITWVADARRSLGRPTDHLPFDDMIERAADGGALLSEMEARCAAVESEPRTASLHVDRLVEVAGGFDGDLWPIRIEQVRARADGRDLADIARRYRRLGFVNAADRLDDETRSGDQRAVTT